MILKELLKEYVEDVEEKNDDEILKSMLDTIEALKSEITALKNIVESDEVPNEETLEDVTEV